MNHAAEKKSSQGERVNAAVMAWIVLLLSPLAISAIAVRIAIYGALSFEVATYGFVVSSVLVVVILCVALRVPLRDLFRLCETVNTSTLCMFAVCCLMAGVATTCLHRADLDDAIYLPKIVHYVAYPKTIMDGRVYEIASAKTLAFPRAAAPYYPTSYEFAEAAFAHVAGIDFLYVYYVVAPFIAGVLGVLGLVACFCFLGVSLDQAACSMLVLIPMMLLMGETHRSFGNVTLVRAFQSKFVFFIVGIPFFTAASIAYFRSRDWYMWAALVTLTLALGGITSSALVMLPLLAVLLSATWWLIHVRREFRIGYLLIYGTSLLPVVLFAIDYRRYAVAWISYGASLNAWFPSNFWGQFDLVYTSGAAPVSLTLCVIALLACLCNPRKNAFVLIWSAIAILTLLNPVVAPWMMRHLTTENIYWRIFYLLPMPLLWGFAYAQVTDRLRSLRARQWLAYALCLAMTGLLFVAPTSTLRAANSTRIGWPGYTMDGAAVDARNILALAPAGTVLAPVTLAQDMAILSARHQQIATRADFLENVLQGRHDEYQLRMSAAQYVAGQGGRADDVIAILRRDEPSTVVLAKGVVDSSILDELESRNFHLAGQESDWKVYVR
jgi:hypothetical protein